MEMANHHLIIYYIYCGFTEIDDQLSFSIRKKEITRKDALSRVLNHNLPKKNMLQYFFDLVGLDAKSNIKKIIQLESFKQ